MTKLPAHFIDKNRQINYLDSRSANLEKLLKKLEDETLINVSIPSNLDKYEIQDDRVIAEFKQSLEDLIDRDYQQIRQLTKEMNELVNS